MAELPKFLIASVKSSRAEYVNLGKSGLKVLIPIFGTISIGDPAWESWVEGEERSPPLLKAAYDLGLNTRDTANIYSNCTSEILVGKAIKKYNIPRHKVVVLTKCRGAVGEEMDIIRVQWSKEIRASKGYVNNHGLSRQAIFNTIDDSLQRLELDYIDLLQSIAMTPSPPSKNQ